MAKECCFDRNPVSHQVNLFDLHHKYADVLHVEDVVRHLQHWQFPRDGSHSRRTGAMVQIPAFEGSQGNGMAIPSR